MGDSLTRTVSPDETQKQEQTFGPRTYDLKIDKVVSTDIVLFPFK